MENQYRKTFPDLMVNKKLVYVHGFMSSGATHTAKILQEYMPQCTVIAPDLPIHPKEAMELLRKIQADERPDIIIGTSMGGMYTEMLYGTDRICVNPAFQMGSTISESNMLGKQVYQNPRKDGTGGYRNKGIAKGIQGNDGALLLCRNARRARKGVRIVWRRRPHCTHFRPIPPALPASNLLPRRAPPHLKSHIPLHYACH